MSGEVMSRLRCARAVTWYGKSESRLATALAPLMHMLDIILGLSNIVQVFCCSAALGLFPIILGVDTTHLTRPIWPQHDCLPQWVNLCDSGWHLLLVGLVFSFSRRRSGSTYPEGSLTHCRDVLWMTQVHPSLCLRVGAAHADPCGTQLAIVFWLVLSCGMCRLLHHQFSTFPDRMARFRTFSLYPTPSTSPSDLHEIRIVWNHE